MTKRFTYTYGTNKEKSLVIMDHLKRQGLCDGEIADLLNELNDENEQLKHDATVLIQSNQDYRKENEQLKQELAIYRKVASCSNCKYHNYDWDIDDGYGGDEYEVCDKGNDVTDGICKDWEEL